MFQKNKNRTGKDLLAFVGLGFWCLFVICSFNWIVSCFVYGIKHPKKTQIEVLLRTPKTFMWDFKD